MRKLSLSLEELAVESFATTADDANRGGTVLARAAETGAEPPCNSPLCGPTPLSMCDDTCDASCDGTSGVAG